MANNFDSNITRKLARIFLDKFETSRVITKSVDTQLLSGQFNPSTGDTVDFKRPTDYVSVRTANGDVSSETASPIVTGKASGVVQDYFTAFVNYDEADEAIKMDQIDQLLAPLATRIVTDMELDFASFMMKNSGLLAGTYGTAADTWDDIAEAGAVLQSHGVPYDDKWCYAVNPYTQRKLASSNRSLGAGGVAGSIIKSSLERATIADDFAGMNVMTSTALASYTTSTVTDRAGTLSGTPTATYLAHKDTMKQTLAVTAMGADAVVKAGEVIQVTGRNRLNLSTRQEILDETGANILWTAVVTADVTLNGSGAGNLVCTGPAIYEAAGAYNSVSSALTSGDVVTRLGAHSTTYQPNLFWHKQALQHRYFGYY